MDVARLTIQWTATQEMIRCGFLLLHVKFHFSSVFKIDFQIKRSIKNSNPKRGLVNTYCVWWQVELLSDEIDMQSGGKIMSDAARDVLVLL